MMNEQLTIGKLAAEARVPVSTIRYYERQGFLSPEHRSQGNYRVYSRVSLERLRFMKAAQLAGLTLSDIRALLACRDDGGSACCNVQVLLENRLKKVESDLATLANAKQVLTRWIDECRQLESGGTCAFLVDLDEQVQKQGQEKENLKKSQNSA